MVGLKVKLHEDWAVVIKTVLLPLVPLLLPELLELDEPIVPTKVEVCPDGYGLTTF